MNQTQTMTPVFQQYKDGFKDGIPIGLGYFAVSFAFGMSAAAGGMSPAIAALISLTNLTSAGQFAALGIILSNGGFFELFLAQLIINLRYMLMSFTLSQRIDPDTPLHARLVAAFGITDEIFAISVRRPYPLSAAYIYGAMGAAIPGWVLGTLTGAVMQDLLPHIVLSALGIAIYGMFLAIIVPPASEERAVLGVVVLSMALATLFQFAPVLRDVSPGFVIIIVTIIASGAAAVIAPKTEEES